VPLLEHGSSEEDVYGFISALYVLEMAERISVVAKLVLTGAD